MKYFTLSLFLLFITACTNDPETEVETVDATKQEEKLVVTENGVFTEYYPDGKSVKFSGQQDDDKQRHGQWIYYSEAGDELSITHYYHGKMHGHTIVKYPNGKLHYVGEYEHGVEVGIWMMYDEKGNMTEKNYDLINK